MIGVISNGLLREIKNRFNQTWVSEDEESNESSFEAIGVFNEQ